VAKAKGYKKKWIMKAQSKWYKGYLKQGSLSKVASKIHLTTFLHNHFFCLSKLFIFFIGELQVK